MNFIAGFLLIFLREEEAFWVLCRIIETLLPNYFTPDMFVLLLLFCFVLFCFVLFCFDLFCFVLFILALIN